MNLSESTLLPIAFLIFFGLVVIIVFREYKNRKTEKVTTKDSGWLYYNRFYSFPTWLRVATYIAILVGAILKGNESSLSSISFSIPSRSQANLIMAVILIVAMEFVYSKFVKKDKNWGPEK